MIDEEKQFFDKKFIKKQINGNHAFKNVREQFIYNVINQ